MDGAEYRTKLLQHAVKRGYPQPTVAGNDWIFAESCSSSKAVVEYEPGLSEKCGYLIYAKGILTSHSSLAPPSRPRYSLQHPKRTTPTLNTIDPYIFAEYEPALAKLPHAGYLKDEYIGKWLIFSKPESIDRDWKIVKDAVEKGELSISAKADTFRNACRMNNFNNPKQYVICVYTSDWRNELDVFKHRDSLRRLGFEQILFYKTNEMPRRGQKGSTYRG